jgi:hypothetical protein
MNYDDLILDEARKSLNLMAQMANGIVNLILGCGQLNEETKRVFKTHVIDGMEEFRAAAACLNEAGGEDNE